MVISWRPGKGGDPHGHGLASWRGVMQSSRDSNGTWNLDSIRHMISDDGEISILRTPIGQGEDIDRLIWPYEKSGRYTVKSGYHWVHHKNQAFNHQHPSTSIAITKDIWKALRKTQTPPNIRNFMWRIFRNSLATNDNLCKRRIRQSPICPICKSHEETLKHILLLCPWVKSVWFRGCLTYRVNPQEVTNIGQWFSNILKIYAKSKDELR
ncbi:PREDICTED: reverse mRNAase [Prunus dulcis]|uniref:PREDICTED: reverse mRNAase n=1 Tax=Prunus dulcis TaxID=3755 RepID=A0A5E4F1R5_PRUDU|nr:hypothetical protein L3X38_012241 [Prunus dulcis]VVA20591.1 PREDICTED: reverse mRNAase [Prunus dulcis]